MNPRIIAAITTAWLLFFPITALAAIGTKCVADAGCEQKAGEYCNMQVIFRSNTECAIEEAGRCRELLGKAEATCLDNACVVLAGTCAPMLPKTEGGLAGTGEKIPTQKPELQVEIPTLKSFSDVEVADDAEGKTFALFPWIGEYIKAVYLYLVGIAGLIAVLVLIHAGFEWMASGGNTHAIENAKKRILNASIGLVILFGSYTILNTINPDLVKFESLTIRIIKGIPIDFEEMLDHREDVEDESGEEGAETLPTPGETIPPPFPDDRARYTAALPLAPLSGNDRYLNPPRPCTVPIPSLSASYPGVRMSYSLLGKLDCNITQRTKKQKRQAGDVSMVILHLGFPAGRSQDMVRMWSNDYHYGPLVRCTEKSGAFNFQSCTKKGQIVRKPPRLKQTPIGSHYSIDANGTVYQLADELHIMAHCCRQNAQSIGIDLLASKDKDGKYVYTDDQYRALAALIKGIGGKYGFAPSDQTIKAHCELGSHGDPPDLKWRQLGKALDKELNPSAHSGGACPKWPEDSGGSGQTADDYEGAVPGP